MSAPQLRYNLQLSQGSVSNLTYVNVGTTATLTVTVTNPGNTVTLDSIAFGFGPFGAAGSDLTQTAVDITPVLPSGWMAIPGTSINVRPISGSAQIGTAALTFGFKANINAQPGTTNIEVTEVTSNGTAFAPPLSVTKMPAGFTLSSLIATPVLVEPNGTVGLTWTGTPGQQYDVVYGNNLSPVYPSPDGTAAYTSPAIQGTSPTAAFTITASSQGMTVQAGITVNVDVPQIASFPQPSAFYNKPVRLNWTTTNADYCVLLANGAPVSKRVPANSPAGGYLVRPPSHVTNYQLTAYKGTTASAQQQISVTEYNWSYLESVGFTNAGSLVTLQLTADGSVLYCGADQLTSIDASSMTVKAQVMVGQAGTTSQGVWFNGLALSADGTTLYVTTNGGALVSYDTTNLASPPTPLNMAGGALQMSADGSTLYIVRGHDEATPSTITALDLTTGTAGPPVNIAGHVASWSLALSSDGTTLYALGFSAQEDSGSLYTIDTTSFTATLVANPGIGPIALDPTGSHLYTCAPAPQGVTSTIQSLAVPGYEVEWTTLLTPSLDPMMSAVTVTGITTDPSGGIYAALQVEAVPGSTPASGLSAFVIDPVAHTAILIHTFAGAFGWVGAAAIDGSGNRLYLASLSTIQAFSSISDRSPSSSASSRSMVDRVLTTQPQLRYALNLSQGSGTGLSYIVPGVPATLTFIVSNSGQPVTVESINFEFSPFGEAASDLAATASDVTVVQPDGWQPVAGSSFKLAPTSGSATIGTEALFFSFTVTPNVSSGTANIYITEITTAGTAYYSPPFQVTKFPGTTVLLEDLAVTPATITPGGTATLTWEGTPGITYKISYPGGAAATLVMPSSGQGSWISPALGAKVTDDTSVPFTVEVDPPGGGAPVAQEQVTATIVMPRADFVQPTTAFFASPITLTWTSQYADHCALYAGGVLLDANAPANPPGGYTVYPTELATDYQLVPYAGTYAGAAKTITAGVHVAWKTSVSTRIQTPEQGQLLVASADGKRVYVFTDTYLSVIDTSSYGVINWSMVPQQLMIKGMPWTAALTPDGKRLFVTGAPQLLVFDTTTFVWSATAFQPNEAVLASVAVSPDGSTVFLVDDGAKSTPTLSAYTLSNWAHRWSTQFSAQMTRGVTVSGDGETVAVRGTDRVSTFSAYSGSLIGTAPEFVLDPSVAATANSVVITSGGLGNPVAVYDVAGGSIDATVAIPQASDLYPSIATDAHGAAYVALDAAAAAQIMYIDPRTGEKGVAYRRPGGSSNLSVATAGSSVFVLDDGELIVLQANYASSFHARTALSAKSRFARLSASSIPTFSGSAIDPRLIDLGLLLGLLTSDNSKPDDQQTVNIGWFASVLSNLAGVPGRAVPLLDLLRRLLTQLGDPVPIDPSGSDGANARDWFSIPYGGADTNFYVVLPKTTAAKDNFISLGFSKSYKENAVSAHVYGVIPAFDVPATPANVFVLGKTAAPIEIHLDITQDGVSKILNGLRLTGLFSFSANPTFKLELLAGSLTQKAFTKVADLLSSRVSRAINATAPGAGGAAMDVLNDIVALSAVQHFLNKTLGSTKATPGTIMGAAPAGLGFLKQTNGTYTIVDLTPFAGKSSVQWAMQVIRVILGAVASSDKPLVPVGTATKGAPAPGIYVNAQPDGGTGTDYGIRLVLPPIRLPVGTPGVDPTLTMYIGDWLAGETAGKTWWDRAAVGPNMPAAPAPGLSVFLVNANAAGTLKFTGRVELASVGVDYDPPLNTPLAQLGGFTLGGVQARGYVKLDLTGSQVVSRYGGALMCRNIGIPLGPGFGSGSGVVKSLLASGGSGDPQASQPVNPAFSLSAAFVNGSQKPVSVQVYDETGKPGGPVWLPMQRSFGPIHLDKLGVGWTDSTVGVPAELSLHLNGGVKLGPLAVDLIDLSISMPPAHPLEPSGYKVGLSGMNVSFAQDPIALDGGLVESNGEYIGQASLNLKTFGIGAIGAYGTVGGSPSLFVFGWTNKAIGGPPYAYVTALAAGFGFNRGLNLPTVDQVQNFPLISAFANSDPFGGGSAPPSQGKQLVESKNALSALASGNYVPMKRGSYWLAAGVQFTSFEMVRTSALLAVEFGPDLTIAILGLSKFQLGSNSNPYVYVELQLLASLKPNDGVLMVQAELSPNSYVLSPDCHLTGGFAFGLWFGGVHEGDFVVTAGGYHPLFRPPAHYPVVPRLGFNWAVSDSVSIQGDAYFALTPGSAMAGGGLQAAYHSGNLRAWVEAQADLLIQWRPFHFNAGIHVSVGVSYKVHLLFVTVTLTVELGAGMELWGPPTGGRVDIDWYVISFSIPFGSDQQGPDPIQWGDFVTHLVPNQPAPPKVRSVSHAHRTLLAGEMNEALKAAADFQPRIDVLLTGGKVRQDPAKGWIVRADGLGFTVRSSVPARTLTYTGNASSQLPAQSFLMGIVPLGLSLVKSGLDVRITPVGAGRINGTFAPAVNSQNMPTAMWGQAAATAPSADTVNLPIGVNVNADVYPAVGVPPIALTTLAFDTIDPPGSGTGPGADAPPAPLPLSPSAVVTPNSGAASKSSLDLIQTTILTKPTEITRDAVLAAVAHFGYGTGLYSPPTGLAKNVTVELRAPVLVGSPAGIAWPTSTAR